MKLIKFLVFYTLFLGILSADEHLFVSLGCNCDVAVKLRENNLRLAAYPFDWILTLDHDRFLQILEDDFEYFLDVNCMVKNSENPLVLNNTYYDVEFRHEWSTDPLNGMQEHLQEFSPRYERRINRFRDLKNYEGQVYFIRCAAEHIDFEQAKVLKTTLDRYFPSLNFTLIIVNYKESPLPKLDPLEGVLEYRIKKNNSVLDYALLLKKLNK